MNCWRGSALRVWFWAWLLTSCGLALSSGDKQRWLPTLVEFLELDYEDHCRTSASTTWDELKGRVGALQNKLEADKSYGYLVRKQAAEVRVALTEHALDHDDALRRRVELLLTPGDTLLESDQWNRLVTFGETAMHDLNSANDYDCGESNSTCSLADLRRNMALQTDEKVLLRMKDSWKQKLANKTTYTTTILPLLRNASKNNKYNNVEEYWDVLCEYEGAVLKARELWAQVGPLYDKLRRYVALRLRGNGDLETLVPVHLLRSLLGDDWSNIAGSILPKKADIYHKINKNLQDKHLRGKAAYTRAAKLLKELNMGEIVEKFWMDSVFDGSCPPTIVDSCGVNDIKVFACDDVSLGNYLDAHEVIMRIKYEESAAMYSNNTYILREANRYSALYEAIPGVASLLALTPHALDSAGLYPLHQFTRNPNHHRLVLQLLLALRDLPRLNYYLAADEWRIKLLSETTTEESWDEMRKSFSSIEASGEDYLGDPHMLFNKPYVGKFMGIILKYQIFQSFADELYTDDANLVQYVSLNNHRLTEPMSKAYSIKWPEMVSDILSKREYGLESSGITDYFRLLDEYLENQLNSKYVDDYIDYNEPIEESVELEPENIPEQTEVDVSDSDNSIDTGDDLDSDNRKSADVHPMDDTESTTVGVLEVKNIINKASAEKTDSSGINKASYSTFLWVGLGLLVLLTLIVMVVIVKKRHSHRKELEREKREQSCA